MRKQKRIRREAQEAFRLSDDPAGDATGLASSFPRSSGSDAFRVEVSAGRTYSLVTDWTVGLDRSGGLSTKSAVTPGELARAIAQLQRKYPGLSVTAAIRMLNPDAIADALAAHNSAIIERERAREVAAMPSWDELRRAPRSEAQLAQAQRSKAAWAKRRANSREASS